MVMVEEPESTDRINLQPKANGNTTPNRLSSANFDSDNESAHDANPYGISRLQDNLNQKNARIAVIQSKSFKMEKDWQQLLIGKVK